MFGSGLLFKSALGHYGSNGMSLDLDFDILRNFNRDERILDLRYFPQQATTGNNLVAFLQTGDQLPVFLGPFHLRADQHEIKQRKYDDQW